MNKITDKKMASSLYNVAFVFVALIIGRDGMAGVELTIEFIVCLMNFYKFVSINKNNSVAHKDLPIACSTGAVTFASEVL